MGNEPKSCLTIQRRGSTCFFVLLLGATRLLVCFLYRYSWACSGFRSWNIFFFISNSQFWFYWHPCISRRISPLCQRKGSQPNFLHPDFVDWFSDFWRCLICIFDMSFCGVRLFGFCITFRMMLLPPHTSLGPRFSVCCVPEDSFARKLHFDSSHIGQFSINFFVYSL